MKWYENFDLRTNIMTGLLVIFAAVGLWLVDRDDAAASKTKVENVPVKEIVQAECQQYDADKEQKAITECINAARGLKTDDAEDVVSECASAFQHRWCSKEEWFYESYDSRAYDAPVVLRVACKASSGRARSKCIEQGWDAVP